MKSIAVYCGSSKGNNPLFIETAQQVGKTLANRNIELVYGAGNVGLMGEIADAALSAGGKVCGVIPQFLKNWEVCHEDLTELIVTENMHQRKQIMVDRSDAFIALPGGFGTLDELFEAITLIQTHKIGKFPIILVGSDFWTGLMDWIKGTMLKAGNISPEDLDLIKIVDTEDEVVEIIDAFYKGHTLSPNF